MSETNDFPTLITDRLLIRELTRDDALIMTPHYQDKPVWKYISSDPAESIEDVYEVIDWGTTIFKSGFGVLWGVFSRENGEFLGEFNYVGRRETTLEGKIRLAEVGYNVVRSHWKKGIASEAMKVIIPHIFTTNRNGAEINRIEATIRPENTASRKLAESLGFKEEGILREFLKWDGEFWDMCLYSLLKKEWQA